MAEATPVKKTRKPRVKKTVAAPVEIIETPAAPEAVEINIPYGDEIRVRSIALSKIWTSNDTLKPGEIALVSPQDAAILLDAGLVERI
jgi:hypothetical protein